MGHADAWYMVGNEASIAHETKMMPSAGRRRWMGFIVT